MLQNATKTPLIIGHSDNIQPLPLFQPPSIWDLQVKVNKTKQQGKKTIVRYTKEPLPSSNLTSLENFKEFCCTLSCLVISFRN